LGLSNEQGRKVPEKESVVGGVWLGRVGFEGKMRGGKRQGEEGRL
jgi:hypothetical protein